MKYHVVITDPAAQDLRDIFSYYVDKFGTEHTARKTVEILLEAISRLDEMPYRFRLYESERFQKSSMRVMPRGKYLIFYVPVDESESVHILRVIYGKLDVDSELEY